MLAIQAIPRGTWVNGDMHIDWSKASRTRVRLLLHSTDSQTKVGDISTNHQTPVPSGGESRRCRYEFGR